MLMRRASQIYSLIGALAAANVCGCLNHIISEPYPAFTYSEIDAKKLPIKIKSKLDSLHPGSEIDEIETCSFKRQVQQYRITFRDRAGHEQKVVFNADGS